MECVGGVSKAATGHGVRGAKSVLRFAAPLMLHPAGLRSGQALRRCGHDVVERPDRPLPLPYRVAER